MLDCVACKEKNKLTYIILHTFNMNLYDLQIFQFF